MIRYMERIRRPISPTSPSRGVSSISPRSLPLEGKAEGSWGEPRRGREHRCQLSPCGKVHKGLVNLDCPTESTQLHSQGRKTLAQNKNFEKKNRGHIFGPSHTRQMAQHRAAVIKTPYRSSAQSKICRVPWSTAIAGQITRQYVSTRAITAGKQDRRGRIPVGFSAKTIPQSTASALEMPGPR